MTDENGRTIDYWTYRWKEGRTGWHLGEANEHLVKNCDLLLPSPDKYRVIVPLCGKSVDLIWLYKQGHTVIGIEAVEAVVLDLYNYHNIEFSTEESSYGKLFKSVDLRLEIHVCDLFAFPPQSIERVDAVWDRGSLVAINASDRERYAALMKKMLLPKFRYLLDTLDYEPNEKFSGPPSSVPPSVVHELFGQSCI